MAVTSNTLIGKSRGKVGNAVFSTWKGINVLKEKGTPSNPQTDAQMAQRMLMAMFVAIYQAGAAIFKVGYSELAVKMSAFNAFISSAFTEEAYSGTFPTFTFDPTKLLAAKGSLWPTNLSTLVSDLSEGTTVATWVAGTGGNQSEFDEAAIAVYNIDRDTWNGNGGALRSTNTISCPLPAGTQVGDNLQVYLFFVQPASGKVSDSVTDVDVVVA